VKYIILYSHYGKLQLLFETVLKQTLFN